MNQSNCQSENLRWQVCQIIAAKTFVYEKLFASFV